VGRGGFINVKDSKCVGTNGKSLLIFYFDKAQKKPEKFRLMGFDIDLWKQFRSGLCRTSHPATSALASSSSAKGGVKRGVRFWLFYPCFDGRQPK
jgi:hypothetical protein